MQKRLCLMLALLSTMVLGAWADGGSSFGGGDGSVKNPYIIKTAAHWDQLASDVNGGTNYKGMFFQLDADISVTTMVGQGTNRFRGTFDGDGHTITVNYTGITEDYCAPFCRISGATIKNLHTAGTIETSGCYASGIVAYTRYYSRIENCHSSVTIRSSHAGWGGHGGILALKAWVTQSEPVIEGCLFDGKILTTGASATIGCGGIVGFTNGQTLTLKNCLYKPAALETGETAVACYTLYENSGGKPSTVTCTNCYYDLGDLQSPTGAAQGKQAHSISIYEGVTIVPMGNATEYNVSSITGFDGNQCVKYNGTVYAGFEDVVTLKFAHNYSGCNLSYYVGNNELSGDDTDGYTLSMPDADVNIVYTMTSFPNAQFVGSGTSDNPYLIGSSGEWDLFVYNINEHKEGYSTAWYRLTDDIEVTTMVGTDVRRFGGHFDGGIYDNEKNLTGYHTLTVNYTTDEQRAAPFRYVDGAKINNLCVAGTINTSNKFAAGFIANAKGTTEITNCRSSVTINSSVNGDGTHGGFVAHNTGGTLIFRGCVFDGYMLGGSTNGCAGFVGWYETNNNADGTVNFTDCLFAPKSTQMVIEKTFVRSRSYASGIIWIVNSHCTANYNNDQQSRIYSVTAGDNVTMATTQSPVKTYSVSGITTYAVGLTFDGVLYAKKDNQLPLTLEYTGTDPSGYVFSSFATTAGSLTGNSPSGDGGASYTLTMGNANANIYATYNIIPTSWSGNGEGNEEHPYEIESLARWNEFVNNVNTGMENTEHVPFATAYYKLTADITVTTMVGTADQRFKGHFDGGGKTLTLNYGTADAPFNENYCAPFRYIEDAVIHDLTVDGTIYTQKQFAGGIAANVLNNNTITDCRSSVILNSSVNGDGTHGGFVAHCQNNADDVTTVTFTRCAFDGQLLSTVTKSWGGFVGWTEGKDWAAVKFIDCIFAPGEVSVLSNDCATFSRGQYGNSDCITVENSYYTQTLGTRQGEMAYVTPPADVTTVPLTIAGVTVYMTKTVVTDVAATNITPTTATISWTGTVGCSNYQVRYRVKPNTEIYSTSFEGGLPDGWTMFENDDEEYNWTYYDGPDDTMPHSGNGCVYSASYINNYGSVQPDNWLVSPPLELGGTMKVWLKGQDAGDYREHFAIYLSTTGGSKSNFIGDGGNLQSVVITLVPETETTSEYQEYTADLSAYDGQNQTGYIAIRHFNCYGEFYLVLDDFGLYNNNDGGEWTIASGGSPAGTTITGLTPGTTYEYQVGYDYGGNTYYTSTATLTTLAEDVAPTNLSATAISANTATISWTGYGDSYNVRYGKGGQTKVTLSVPSDIWGDDSGYQMLLDENHNTYGTVIPKTGGLTISGDAPDGLYDYFEYKIPEDADGDLDTENVLNGTDGKKSVTITIPSGIYDWCITNPTPYDRVWIASGNGNVGSRQDDFVFEAGKHYTFTVTYDGSVDNDCVNMSVEDDATLGLGEMTTETVTTESSYNLSGLTASTFYTVYVQSVKGSKTSEWSRVNFTTLKEGELYLYDDQDNSTVLANSLGQTVNVTLQGRTLIKDGAWNTLCLPFALTDGDTDPGHSSTSGGNDGVTFTGTLLEGAEVMGFDHASFHSATGTLEMVFNKIYTVPAGQPFLVRWDKADGYDEADPETRDLKNPVFTGVTITAEEPQTNDPEGYDAAFVGTYGPVNIYTAAKTNLYLGADNKLYYPWAEGMTSFNVNACRAYFRLNNGLTCGTPGDDYDPEHGSPLVRAFNLSFDGESSQGISDAARLNNNEEIINAGWYTLDGVRLSGKPTNPGLYIHYGRKVVVHLERYLKE